MKEIIKNIKCQYIALYYITLIKDTIIPIVKPLPCLFFHESFRFSNGYFTF